MRERKISLKGEGEENASRSWVEGEEEGKKKQHFSGTCFFCISK